MEPIDVKKLAYEKITDVYYKANYLGLDCIIDITNGYVNGTKLCLSSNNKSKTITNYMNHYRHKLLFVYYMSNIDIYADELFKKVTDGVKQIRGTYIHPILFLDLAIWVSRSAYIKASKIISTTLLNENTNENTNENKEALIRIEKGIIESLNREEDIAKQNERIYARFANSLRRIETIVTEQNQNQTEQKKSFSFLHWFENTLLFCKKNSLYT